MVCGVFGLLAIILLALAWSRLELSVGLKLTLTGIYIGTWLLWFAHPLAMMLFQAVYALGLYFFLFGSERGRRWKP